MSTAATGDGALDSLVQKLYQRAHRDGNENFTVDIKRARKVLTLTERRVDQALSLYLELEAEERIMQMHGVPEFKDQVKSEPYDRPPDGNQADETTATPERAGPRQSSPEQDAIVVAQLVPDSDVEREPERTCISPNNRVPEEQSDVEEGPERTVTSNPQTPAYFDRSASSERKLQPEGVMGELVDKQPSERIDESVKGHFRGRILVVYVLIAMFVIVVALVAVLSTILNKNNGGEAVDLLREPRDVTEPPDNTMEPQVGATKPPDPEVCECDEAAELLVVGGLPVPGTVLGGEEETDIEDCGVDWTGNRTGRWYSVCGNGQTLNATTCTDDASMNGRFDSVITVWSGNFTDIWSLQCIGGNDDDKFDSCQFESGLIWNSQNNTCYYIHVVAWDANDTQPDSFGIQVKEQSLDSPVTGDKIPPSVCTEAISLSIGGSPVSSSAMKGDTLDTSPPLCGGIASKFPGRWFEVRGNGKRLYATTCTDDTSLHNKTDTLITVWSRDCDDLHCERGNDDYEDMDHETCEWESLAEWKSQNDQMYYIYVQVQTFHDEQKQPFAIQIIESEEQDDDDDDGCFPSGATVETKSKGYIPIEEVKLGDELRTATGFSSVYAFAMRTASKMTRYRKFTTASSHTIEMAEDGIVFIGEHLEPKLAIEVQIGDLMICMPEKQPCMVTSVETVKREGAIHPLTYDSTIVVNGVLVSAHYGVGFVLVIKIHDYYLVNKHEFQQILFSPLRLICRLSREKFCGEVNHYDNDGSHHYVRVIENIHAFLRPERVRPDGLVFEENFPTVSAFLPFKLLLFFCLVIITVLDYVIDGLHFSFMTVVLATSLFYLVFASVKTKFKSQVKKKKQD